MRLFDWFKSGRGEKPLPPPAPPVEAYRALFGDQTDPPPPAPTPPSREPQAPPPPNIVIEHRPHADDPQYRTPTNLAVSELAVSRILVIGSCMSQTMPIYLGFAFRAVKADHILYNHAGTLPAEPPQPLESYDFQVVMLALRSVLPESIYFRLGHTDLEGHEAAFATARERLIQMLHGALAYRDRQPILTFVANYVLPQQNPMGRLLPRYDLRNPVFFVEQLNRVIAEEIAGMPGVHLLDIDQISANFGRKYIQDDLYTIITHHSTASDYDHKFDGNRLEVPQPMSRHYVLRVQEYLIAVCQELRAMYRTVRQADQVKLVIVDLDDTLWRGVIAEEGIDRQMLTEGWPLGVAEALAYLRKRGVLLAIASRNDEARIRTLWPRVYGSRLELSDFEVVKMNWEPKAANIEAILADVNLLPRNVVFIDDNPVERAAVAAAFPDMRVLSASPYAWRRILLWSPETQVAHVTEESARRTEMIKAQVARESARSRLGRDEFLASLDIRIRLLPIGDLAAQGFARALELINKSNQFNTTGRRWTQPECQAAFNTGTVFWAFEVDDRFTSYGLVGVAILTAGVIEQFVMSCRVVGLDVEIAVISSITAALPPPVRARIVPTDANFLCRDLFERCGFSNAGDHWFLPDAAKVPCPPHIRAIDTLAPVPLA